MKMLVRLYLLLFVIDVLAVASTDKCANLRTSLDSVRKRRYLAFPDGSNVVVTLSAVKAFMTHAPSGWMLVLEADVAWPLPNANFTSTHLRRKTHHRQKKDLWDRVKTSLDFHNMNGRSCVLRSICEAKTYLGPPGKSLVHDLLRAIFTAPLHEPDFVEEIGDTYNELLEPDFCDKPNDCPLSLLHLILTLNRRKY